MTSGLGRGDWVYCSHCGMKLPDWAHYCERCGTRVRRRARGAAPSGRGNLRNAFGQREPDLTHATPLQDEDLHDVQALARDGSETPAFTVNDAIRQELDTLAEPASLDDLDRFVWPAQREVTSSHEPTADGADEPVVPALVEDGVDATPADVEPQVEEPSQAADTADEYAADGGAREPQGEAHDTAMDVPEDASEPASAAELEEGAQEPSIDSDVSLDADATEEELPEEELQATEDERDALAAERQADEDSSDVSVEAADFWSTQQFERIDVGEDDFPTETYIPTYHRSVEDRRRIQETYAFQMVPEHKKPQHKRLQRIVLTVVGAGVVVLSFVLTYPVLNWAMQGSQPVVQEASEPVHYVSKRRAKKIVRSLEGWWTTNRTFDGRYWRIKDGVLETYAADGNLTKKRNIKVDEIELAPDALEGVEGKGYILHGIDFYLSDSDPDTLHAIDVEGKPNKEANLIRTDEPSFAKGE